MKRLMIVLLMVLGFGIAKSQDLSATLHELGELTEGLLAVDDDLELSGSGTYNHPGANPMHLSGETMVWVVSSPGRFIYHLYDSCTEMKGLPTYTSPDPICFTERIDGFGKWEEVIQICKVCKARYQAEFSAKVVEIGKKYVAIGPFLGDGELDGEPFENVAVELFLKNYFKDASTFVYELYGQWGVHGGREGATLEVLILGKSKPVKWVITAKQSLKGRVYLFTKLGK